MRVLITTLGGVALCLSAAGAPMPVIGTVE
jgi:hypothetical protein